MHKLREVDGDWSNRYRNRLLYIGNENKRKRNESQAKYRKKRKLR